MIIKTWSALIGILCFVWWRHRGGVHLIQRSFVRSLARSLYVGLCCTLVLMCCSSLPPTGSPSQLSPASTISNGPAPTIPDAPSSPRGFDQFDMMGQFGYYNHAYSGDSSRASSLRPGSQLSNRDYQHDSLMSPMSQHSDMLSPYSQTNGHATYDHKYNSLPGGYGSGVRDSGQHRSTHNGHHSMGPYGDHPSAASSTRRSYGQPKEVYNRGYRTEEPTYPRYEL